MARYGVSGLAHRLFDTRFPVGTLTENTLGCLAIGALMSAIEDRQLLSPDVRTFLTVGVLGGFTTFSSLGYETLEMLRHGDMRLAALNIAGNLVLGLGAVTAGWMGARALLS
jgi:CrcB protein